MHWIRVLCLLPLLLSSAVEASQMRIAAASDLRFVMPELVARFGQLTGTDINVTYGSSGNLATQIRYGAPYDMFFSADRRYTSPLVERGLTRGETMQYARGHLALFTRHDSPLSPDDGLANLRMRLEAGTLGKFVIANPQHAPYGQMAQQRLQAEGLWEAIRPRLLYAENAAQAMQFALTTDVEGGIVPYALASLPQMQSRGKSVRLAGSLAQHVVILKQAPAEADDFIDFIASDQADKIFIKHGFEPLQAMP